MATEKGNRIDAVGDWMIADHTKDGTRYYLGTVGTTAGLVSTALGIESLHDQDPVLAGIEIAAGLGIIATATGRLGVREKLKATINAYASGCAAILIGFGLPFMLTVLGADDLRFYAASEIAAAGAVIASSIKNHRSPQS